MSRRLWCEVSVGTPGFRLSRFGFDLKQNKLGLKSRFRPNPLLFWKLKDEGARRNQKKEREEIPKTHEFNKIKCTELPQCNFDLHLYINRTWVSLWNRIFSNLRISILLQTLRLRCRLFFSKSTFQPLNEKKLNAFSVFWVFGGIVHSTRIGQIGWMVKSRYFLLFKLLIATND